MISLLPNPTLFSLLSTFNISGATIGEKKAESYTKTMVVWNLGIFLIFV
jgi:hypothetical protein